MQTMTSKIIKFLEKNPSPKDEQLHKFAETLSPDHAKMEATAEKSMKKAYIRIFDNLYVYMGKAVPKSTYQHSNKLGAGAEKRKGLKNPQDKVEAVMHEFKTGKLHSGSGKIVTDRKQAIAIAMSESGQSKKMKIEEKESGHKSVPKEYKGVKNFADMTNKRYPLDNEKHVRAAISYFAMPRNHSEYKPEERKTIAGKIQSAAKKYNIDVSDEWLEKFGLKEKMQKAIIIKYNELYKAKSEAVGTVHTYKSGLKYKKTADGKWIQISEGKKDTQGTKLDDKEKTFDKQENPQKSKNKELLKNTIKKIADIIAQALKGGETNPAAGRAVEQLGENIKREPKEKSKKVKK